MAGAIKASGGKKGAMTPNAEPNVIPFIDIMLVLLIIFMVASPPPTVDIKVDLPPPVPTVQTKSPDKPTFVSLEDNGGLLIYRIEGREVERAEIADRLLATARIRNPTKSTAAELYADAKVYVDADQDTAYANVVSLMNEINAAGFQKVSLVAEEASF